MPTDQFYPPLTDIMELEDIPSQLGFIKNGLNNLFNGLYFRNLQHTKGKLGDSAFYSLTVISYKTLGVEMPGTGITLLLNPDNDATGVTAIDMKVHYEWKILRFVNGFSLQGFAFNGPGFFNLLIKIIDVSPQQLVREAIEQYAGTDNVNKFIDDLNAKYGLGLPYAEADSVEEKIDDVIAQAESMTGWPILSLLFPLYLLDAGSDGNTQKRIEQLFHTILGGKPAIDLAKELLVPKVDASMEVGIALEFPRSVLVPLNDTPGADYGKPKDAPAVTTLPFAKGTFRFSTESGIGYDQELTATLPLSEIGTTGLTLKAQTAKFDLSTKENFAEVDADGRPKEFVGVYIKEAEIGLPQFWQDAGGSTAKLVGTNLIIGTGGFSGTVGMKALNPQGQQAPLLKTTIGGAGGFSLGLTSFDLTFRQNAVTASSIKGFLTIPGAFKDKATGDQAKIDVGVSIGNNTFDVTASSKQGLVLSIASILEFTVFSLSVGKQDGKFYIATSGTLELIAKAPGGTDPLLPVKIDIKKLLIYQDGSFEFAGGVSLLQQAISLKLGPVELTVTALTFGTHEQFHDNALRKYAYFGFDGGLSLDPVGVDARGDGIKFYFTVDNNGPLHTFMRIEGIGIDLVIPGTADAGTAALLLSGYLSMKQPDPPDPQLEASTEYMGAVTFSLPKLGLAGSAAMRLNPKVPAFILDVGLELPVPILLGATGLGIYGFRGVVGNAYVPSKAAAGVAEDEPWWAYYKKKSTITNKEGISIDKFQQKDGFSIGAGASLATAPDAGRSFSSKLFFLLGLPDVFLLQGQAAIMRERIGLDTTTDPPFYALIAITSSSIEAAFGVDYKIPEPDGEILQLGGTLEMGFFFKNASGWYINVGRDQPENKRVKAIILTLFEGYSYLMLSSSGIKAGSGVHWDFSKHYGPVGIEVGCYLDMGGFISFKPIQLGGFISLGGYARVVVFGFKFGFDVSASLAAEAPRPFIVTGKFKLTLNLFWPLDDIHLEVGLTWVINGALNLDEIPFLDTSQMDKKSPASAINLATKGAFPLNYLPPSTSSTIAAPAQWNAPFDNYVIPIDSRIDIEFSKAVKPGGKRLEGLVQGYVYSEYVAPQKAKAEQVRHDFIVEDVRIFYRDFDNGAWNEFDVYAANTPLKDVANVDQNLLNNGPYGYWQLGETPNKFTKLSILSLTPFSYITQGSPGNVVPEQLGYPETVLLCAEEKKTTPCQHWESIFSTIDIPSNEWFEDRKLLYLHTSAKPLILPAPNPFGFTFGVKIGPDEKMQIAFDGPKAEVFLKLSSLSSCVKVAYYKREKLKQNQQDLPDFQYTLIEEALIDQAHLQKPVHYLNADAPVDMVELSSCPCKPGESDKKADALFETWAKAELERLNILCRKYTDLVQEIETICLRKRGTEGSWKELEQRWGVDLWDDPCEQLPELWATGSQYCRQVQILVDHIDRKDRTPTPEKPPEGPAHPSGGGQEQPHINPYTCSTFLHQVCWLSVEDHLFNETLPGQDEVKAKNEAMVESMKKIIQPVWRPNTYYAIQIQTLDKLTAGKDTPEYRRYYNFGFRTAGGIGHFHEYKNAQGNKVLRQDYASLKNGNKEDEYKLASLKHYIDYDRSYPNADGNIINAKPLFYKKAKLLLFYKFPYVYSMFSNWDQYGSLEQIEASLSVVIKDPAEHNNASNPNEPGNFMLNDLAVKEDEFVIIENMILNGANCSGVQGPVTKPSMNLEVQPKYLKPSKLYSAIFIASIKYTKDGKPDSNEVHKYNFQTSRYADFKEQINSYILSNKPGKEKHAVFTITQSFSAADLQLMKDVVKNNNNSPAHKALQPQFADPFDRLLNGAMKMQPLNAATTTEFNIIKNVDSGKIAGVLLRSPEPLNDPKLPKNLLTGSISFVHKPANSPNIISSFDTVYSKDNTSVFITNADLDILPGKMELSFTYNEFNGDKYISADSGSATITVQ